MDDARDIRILAVPYDSGHRRWRMGGGPEHLLANGLVNELGRQGREARTEVLHPENTPRVEVATAFELDTLVSEGVRGAIGGGEFPLVLSGNCNTSVGTLAGANPEEGLGIVWFDGHVDFNTPETTTTGFSDNMGLAIAVGRCWKAIPAALKAAGEKPEQPGALGIAAVSTVGYFGFLAGPSAFGFLAEMVGLPVAFGSLSLLALLAAGLARGVAPAADKDVS